jgi:hypothetical protein
MPGVVQGTTDLVDALGEAAVGHDDVLPDLAHQAVALDDVTGLGRQAAEHREGLGARNATSMPAASRSSSRPGSKLNPPRPIGS